MPPNIKPLKLKCGLEIHSQLNSKFKLFSLSPNTTNEQPNTKTSFFDLSLPGTQPKLNPEPLLFALKLSKSLNCTLNHKSQFDRKHYFYGDQPLGYQITQHYSPISKNGEFKLIKQLDGIDKTIRIEQLQIEQDTGKSMYNELDDLSKIDLNRSNIPLIEMVTKPDFEDSNQVKVFIKKFQNLLRYLGISTGDLESGAMRIDVNISLNDNPRVELKNLSTTSSVINAINHEFQRQSQLITNDESHLIVQETRGWNGLKTIRLRSKENSLDYRYMPDPELPLIKLQNGILDNVKLPQLPDEICSKLLKAPYNLKLKDSTILTYDLTLLNYYLQLFQNCSDIGISSKLPGNWLIHELLGLFYKSNVKFDPSVITHTKLTELLTLIHKDQITNSSAKLLLQHIFHNEQDRTVSLIQLVQEFDLGKSVEIDDLEITKICQEIINDNPKTVNNLNKKPNGLKFLIGRAMGQTQGKINVNIFEEKFKSLLKL